MRKLLAISPGVFVVGWLIFKTSVWAAAPCPTFDYQPKPLYNTSSEVTFTMGPAVSGSRYLIEADCSGPSNARSPALDPVNNSVSHTFPNSGGGTCAFALGTHNVSLWKVGEGAPLCTNTYTVGSRCKLDHSPERPTTADSVTISGTFVPFEADYMIVRGPIEKHIPFLRVQPDNTFSVSIGNLSSSGHYTVQVGRFNPTSGRVDDVGCPSIDFDVKVEGEPEPIPAEYELCGSDDPGKPNYNPNYQDCKNCLGGTTLDEPGSWTALGCIPVDTSSFIAWLLKRVIGLAGGIAFLLILYGGFQILTSTGDPEKLTSGKDIVVSAIAGLLMIIFSVLLLRIIGVDILQIPGLGG